MAQHFTWVLLVLLLFLLRESSCFNECQTKIYEEPGDVMLSMIVSMRENTGQGTCGDVTYGSIQSLLAVKYVLQKLNSNGDGGDTFIPGVKLGFKVYDDCGNKEYAAAHALDSIRAYYPDQIIECAPGANLSVLAGIIGPDRSQTTAAVAEVLRSTEIPLVSMGATLPELSNKTKYPNVLRTTVSDSIQSRAIVSLLKELKWSVVSIVHTADNYGADLAGAIQRLAKTEQICVIHVDEITNQPEDIVRVIDNLLLKQKRTADESMGVIYLGQQDVARSLIRSVQQRLEDALQPNKIALQNLKWIMPDSVGTNGEVLAGFENFVLTISPTSIRLPEFGRFVQSAIDSVKDKNPGNVTNPWLVDYVKKACYDKLLSDIGCNSFKQNDYVEATLNAVYALSAAVRSAHREICKGAAGMCEAFRSVKNLDILSHVRNVSLPYRSLDINHSVPELAANNTQIEFYTNGDIRLEEGRDLFTINNYQGGAFHKVGSFVRNGIQLDPTFTQQDRKTSCKNVCEECVAQPSFVYLAGKILLAGFYSMRWAPAVDNPFGCGKFRTEVHTVIAVEAFLYMVKKLRADTGLDLGAIIFDDCYSNLKADLIISKYFSGEIQLIDPKTGKIIDLSGVIAIIGSESSSVTLPLAAIFSRLRLPVVSPASTSPDLDDRGLYPYFLRTVPSEKDTGDVMVAVIKHFMWEYINIVYVNNNYGYKVMLKVQEKAKEEGICVAEPSSLDVNPAEKDMIDLIQQLGRNGARVVLFIGIEEDAKSFQRVLKVNEIDLVFLALEDWAVTLKPLAGTERAIAGSLVFKSAAPKIPPNEFSQYLQERIPNSNETSVWFDKFWQSQFECNLPGRFENTYAKACDLSDQRFEKATAENWLGHFRIGNTINAVASVIAGVQRARKFLCTTEEEFACKKLRENPREVTKFIREITLGTGSESFRPFRDDGNGNTGIRIYNLQRIIDGTYEYIAVGTYDLVRNELILAKDRTVFYSKGVPVQVVKADCTVQEICKRCKLVAVNDSSLLDTSPAYCPSGGGMTVAILVLVCIICLLGVIAIVVCVCIQCRRWRNKGTDGISSTQRPLTPRVPAIFTRSQRSDDNLPSTDALDFVNQPPSYHSRVASMNFETYDTLHSEMESERNKENIGNPTRNSRPMLDHIDNHRVPSNLQSSNLNISPDGPPFPDQPTVTNSYRNSNYFELKDHDGNYEPVDHCKTISDPRRTTIDDPHQTALKTVSDERHTSVKGARSPSHNNYNAVDLKLSTLRDTHPKRYNSSDIDSVTDGYLEARHRPIAKMSDAYMTATNVPITSQQDQNNATRNQQDDTNAGQQLSHRLPPDLPVPHNPPEVFQVLFSNSLERGDDYV